VKDIFYILKNRSVQREKMLAQRENMLIEREQAVTQREERVAQKEQIIGEDFKYQEEKQNELFSLEVKNETLRAQVAKKESELQLQEQFGNVDFFSPNLDAWDM